jgi:hypothetical protein
VAGAEEGGEFIEQQEFGLEHHQIGQRQLVFSAPG